MIVKLQCEIAVPFEEYPTKALNKGVETQVRNWVKETLKSLDFIPIYVEKDEHNNPVEDHTKAIRVKISSELTE